MTRKKRQETGGIITSTAFIVSLFIVLEFTDIHSKFIPCISTLENHPKTLFKIPHCIEIWSKGEMVSISWIVLLAFLIAVSIFLYQLTNWIRTISYVNRRGQHLKLLGSIMLLLWSIGWILYLQAFLYFPDEYKFVNAEILLRSAIASLDLFMLKTDSTILGIIKEHAHLKGAITITCLLSFACTAGLFISLVSARIYTYLKLVFFSKVTKKRSHLYILFGIEKQMELLANSIREKDENSIRIFVEKTKSDENDGKEGWSHFAAMITHRKESFKKVKDLGSRLTLTNYSINSLGSTTNVLGEAGLNIIKKKIGQLATLGLGAELHLFFLFENEAKNIESTAVISKDDTIMNAAKCGIKVIIYCHARHNSVNAVIEQSAMGKNIEIRIIDSAHLAIEQLKMREHIDLQPVSFVHIEKNGTTASEFNSLVVGFNEVGQDAVRFLYEYGAFVHSDKTNGVRRSPFCCHVVDSNMKNIAPHYMDTHMRMNCHRTGEKLPLIAFDSNTLASINLHSYGYKEQAFFSLLNQIIDKLNYVLIATDDDIENITLAIWLLKHAMRKKKDLSNFKILIRSYSREKTPHVEEIAKYYNGIAYAEIVNKATMHSKSENESTNYDIIHIFGKAEQIFSFQSIINEQIRKESWQYYNSYNSVKVKSDKDFASLSDEEKSSGKYCSESMLDYAWNIRHEKELSVRIKGYPKYSNVMSIRRKESQDMENALHRYTKRVIALKALNNESLLCRMESGIRHYTITRNESNEYVENGKVQRQYCTIMTTLAQMEHLRWNASHEMLCYVWGPEKDEAYSEHDCLVSWEDLASDIIRGYDYEVVDRSFRLADEERK